MELILYPWQSPVHVSNVCCCKVKIKLRKVTITFLNTIFSLYFSWDSLTSFMLLLFGMFVYNDFTSGIYFTFSNVFLNKRLKVVIDSSLSLLLSDQGYLLYVFSVVDKIYINIFRYIIPMNILRHTCIYLYISICLFISIFI